MYPLQSLGSAQKSSWSRDSSSSPLSHVEEDHVYRYPAAHSKHCVYKVERIICHFHLPVVATSSCLCLSPRQFSKQTEVIRLVDSSHDLCHGQQPLRARQAAAGTQRSATELPFIPHYRYTQSPRLYQLRLRQAELTLLLCVHRGGSSTLTVLQHHPLRERRRP